jgi:hypothetical protein
MMSNIPLTGCATVYLSVYLWKDILAIINKVAVNTHEQVLCGYKFLTHLNKYQGAPLMDHM